MPKRSKDSSLDRSQWRRAARAAATSLRGYRRKLAIRLSGPGSSDAHSPTMPALDLASHALGALWLGHATVLLRVGGLTILTDPVLTPSIGVELGPWHIGLRRTSPLPIAPAHLPPIDLVLLSHAHFDHLDRPSLRLLASKETTVITARRTGMLVPGGFQEVIELPEGQTLRHRGVEVAALPAKHWGARSAWDQHRGANAYAIAAGEGSVFFAGDTAYTTAFDDAGPIDLAILGIGSYDPWELTHATPEQAWAMFQAMRGGHLLPIHHSTFPLGNEPVGDPLRRLLAAAGEQSPRIVGVRPGALWIPGMNPES
jgi:L-ascorbate metabolism protein UlaG (beta-lactamase superfamily)